MWALKLERSVLRNVLQLLYFPIHVQDHRYITCTYSIEIINEFYILTIKQAKGMTAVISLLSWIEPTSFTCPLLCEVRSLNTVPRCSSGTITTMLVQGSSSCTSTSLRAFETPSEMHEESDGSEVMLPRVREVTDTQTFWTGNANKGPGGLHMYRG